MHAASAIDKLAEFISQLSARDLPDSALQMARRCLVDTVGAAVAGHRTDAAEVTRGVALDLFGAGPSRIWFSAERRQPASAAFANSAAASALDLDDGHRAASGHPGASVVPAVVAVAEQVTAPERNVAAAIVIGYEVGVRVAAARDMSSLDTVSTGRWCSYAAAAAGGWLRGLRAPQLAEALATAGTLSPMLASRGRRPHQVKEGIPWSTLLGLMALDLAERGFTGPTDLLDRRAGVDAEAVVRGLGESYLIERVYFKPYSCCRWIHAAIDALLELQAEFDLRPEEILKIEVQTFTRAAGLYNEPRPGSLEAAQYSFPFCLAVVAYEGVGALQPLRSELLRREDILALAGRVEVRVSRELDALFPQKVPAVVAVHTQRGRFERRVDDPLGDPGNPMDIAQLEAKFRRLTDGVWPSDQAQRAASAALAPDDGSIAGLLAALSRGA